MPDEAIGCGFHEAVRGVLSHHLVIRDKKIANYHPYPPTPWNGSPTDSYGTPGPYEDAVTGQPIFEENGPDDFRGIDIMRAVRSFDPCLPCGVHMYLGGGKTLKRTHSPMFGSQARLSGGRPGGTRARRAGRGACSTRSSRTRPAQATELVQALLELYGEGLARHRRRPSGCHAARWSDDDLVAHLLLLHDLHPVAARGAGARRARGGAAVPRLARGGVELVGIDDGRGAAADAGKLQRLPVVDDDAEARDRGRDPQGGAGRRGDRGRGRGRGAGAGAGAPAPDGGRACRAARRRRGPPPARWRSSRAAARSSSGWPASRCCSCGSTTRRYAYRPRCPSCGADARRARRCTAPSSLPGLPEQTSTCAAPAAASTQPQLHLEPVPLLAADAGLRRSRCEAAVA